MQEQASGIDPSYKFENFFKLSPDLLCIAGFDGYFKRINPAVSEQLGYSIEELSSRPITSFVHPDDREQTKLLQTKLSNSNPVLNFENRYLTKDGRVIWLSWTSIPVPEDKLVYAIAKNITEKKQLEEERNQHLANLTQVHQDLKQFSYTTSHDLRSPVNNLLSIINLLDEFNITDENIQKYLSFLKSSAQNLNDTLNNSVDVMIQKDKLNVKIEELNLKESLNHVLGSIQSHIQNSKVKIDADFSELESINFNKAYLESIFLNLVTNSIKYAQPELTPVIKIKSKKTDNGCQIIFTDNGMGFDMEKVKDKVFGLHQKFHNHSDSKGIGLYLIYNHITSLGGRITLDSQVNHGSTFTLYFRA